MAKKKSSRKASARLCPTNLKADARKSGLCFRVERVQRNGDKGYVTSFFSRTSGRSAGFSASSGCKRTLDPFQAEIRPKKKAEQIGQKCAVVASRKK